MYFFALIQFGSKSNPQTLVNPTAALIEISLSQVLLSEKESNIPNTYEMRTVAKVT